MVFFYDAETYRGLTRLSTPSPKYPADWLAFVRDTKVLYYKSHYKRCANQCEQMLHDYRGTLHPLHETFLHFYIAICNESIGLAAHKFSAKKLQFLNVAKDAFTAAIVSLPSPLASAECDTNNLLGLLPDPSALADSEESDQEIHTARSSESDSSSSNRSTLDAKHSLHERCDFGYDSEPELLPAGTDTTPDFNSYTAREPLVAILSPNNHTPEKVVQRNNHHDIGAETNNLMPKPLSIKKRTATTNNSSILDPIPTPPSPSTTDNLLKMTTSQLNRPDQLSSISASSTSPNPSPSPLQPHLSTFHTLLTTHLTTITTTILHTTALQHAHKVTQSHRVASFWSFQPVQQPLVHTSVINSVGGSGRVIGVARAADQREGDAASQEKKERIERLRRVGWLVSKERHGWKGRAFYEELRGRALMDLGVGGRRGRYEG